MSSSGPPLDPTGLQVQWVTSYDINVSWDSGDWSNGGLGIQNFVVSWTPGDNGGSFVTDDATATSYTITGLNPGESYAIAVTAYNADTPPTPSPGNNTIHAVTALDGQPLDPRNIVVEWITPVHVGLSWDAADPNGEGRSITDYAISWTPKGLTGVAGHIDLATGISGISGYTGLSGTALPLYPNAEYEFTVQAYNADIPPLVSPGYTYVNARTVEFIPPFFDGDTGIAIDAVAGVLGNGHITSTLYSYDIPANTTIAWTYNRENSFFITDDNGDIQEQTITTIEPILNLDEQGGRNGGGVDELNRPANSIWMVTSEATENQAPGSYGTISTITRLNIGGGTFYPADARVYTCTITDSFGSAAQSFTLNLTPGSTGPIPVDYSVSSSTNSGVADTNGTQTFSAIFEFTKPRSGGLNFNNDDPMQPPKTPQFGAPGGRLPMVLTLYRGPGDSYTNPSNGVWNIEIDAFLNLVERPLRVTNDIGYMNMLDDQAGGLGGDETIAIKSRMNLDDANDLGQTIFWPFGPGTYTLALAEYADENGSPPTRVLLSEVIHFYDSPPGFTGPTAAADNTFDISDGDPDYWQTLFPSGTSFSATPPTIKWTYNQSSGPTINIVNDLKYIVETSIVRINQTDPYFTFASRLTRNNAYQTWSLADSGTYTCTATNDFGSSSCTYVLNISLGPPIFPYLMDYQSGPAAENISYSFAAPSVWGSQPISYSWWYGGINAMGGTGYYAIGGLTGQTGPDDTSVDLQVYSDSLTITSPNQNSIGRYFLKATNAYGSDSVWADITEVGMIPSRNFIADQTVPIGSFVVFFNDQTGITPAPSYQWYKDNKILTGQIGASITITNAGYSDSGSYNCLADNGLMGIFSEPGVLSLFETSNSGLGAVEVYESGRGYSKAPTPYLSGAGELGEIGGPYADRIFIKNIPFAGVGWNNFQSTPTILVNGVVADGSSGASGCAIIPIMHKNPSDYFINQYDRGNALFANQIIIYEPVNAEVISDNGSGAQVNVLRYDPFGVLPTTALDLDYIRCIAYNAAIQAGRTQTDATAAGALAVANAQAQQQKDQAAASGSTGGNPYRLPAIAYAPPKRGCGACPETHILGYYVDGASGSNAGGGCSGGVGYGCTGCMDGAGYGCTGCIDGVGFGCTGCKNGIGYGCTGCDDGYGYGCTGCYNGVGYGCTGYGSTGYTGGNGCTGIGCDGRTGCSGGTGYGCSGPASGCAALGNCPPPCANPPCGPKILDCTPTITPTPKISPGGNIFFIYDWGVGPNQMKVDVAYKNSYNADDPNSYEHIVFASERCVGDNQASQGQVLNSFNAKPCVLTRVLDWIHQIPPTADLVITRGDGDTTGDGLTGKIGFRDISSRSGTRTYAWGSNSGANGLYNKMWEPVLVGLTGGNNLYTVAPYFQLVNLRCEGNPGPCNAWAGTWYNCLDQDAAGYAQPKFGWYYSDLCSEYGSPFQSPDVCSWKYDFTSLQSTTTLLDATALYGGAMDDYSTTTANHMRDFKDAALAFWMTRGGYDGLTGGTGYTGGVPPATGGSYTPGSTGGTGAYYIHIEGNGGGVNPRNLAQAFAYFISADAVAVTGYTGYIDPVTFVHGYTGFTGYITNPNTYENYGMDLPYEFGGWPQGGYQTTIDAGQATLQVLGGLVGFGGSTLGQGTWQAGGPYPPMGRTGAAMFPRDALAFQKAIAAGTADIRKLNTQTLPIDDSTMNAVQDTASLTQPFRGYYPASSPDAIDPGSLAMLGKLNRYLTPAQQSSSGRTAAKAVTLIVAVGLGAWAVYYFTNYRNAKNPSGDVAASTQYTKNRSPGYTETIFKPSSSRVSTTKPGFTITTFTAPTQTTVTDPGTWVNFEPEEWSIVIGGEDAVAAQEELRDYYDTYKIKTNRILELQYEESKLKLPPLDPVVVPTVPPILPEPTPTPTVKYRVKVVKPTPVEPPRPPPKISGYKETVQNPMRVKMNGTVKGAAQSTGAFGQGRNITGFGGAGNGAVGGGIRPMSNESARKLQLDTRPWWVKNAAATNKLSSRQLLDITNTNPARSAIASRAERNAIGSGVKGSAIITITRGENAPAGEEVVAYEQSIADAAAAEREAKRLTDLAAVQAEIAQAAADAEQAAKNIVASHQVHLQDIIDNPNITPDLLAEAKASQAEFEVAAEGFLEMNTATSIPELTKQLGLDGFTKFLNGIEIPTADKLILSGAKIVTTFALEKGVQAFKIIKAALPAISATAPTVIRGLAKGGGYFIEGTSRVVTTAGSLVTRGSKVATGFITRMIGPVVGKVLGALFAVAGIIADIAQFATGALQICSSFQFGGVGVYFPDPYASAWVNAGFLPYTPGSIVLSKVSIAYGLEFVSIGQGYLPGDFVRVSTGGVAQDATQFFQVIGGEQPAEPYDIALDIRPMPPSYKLQEMAIASQGVGFSKIPSIGVTGGGGDTGAPPQWYANMTCSTLGPLTHTSTDSFLYPPGVYVSPGNDPRNVAKAVCYLSPNITDSAGPGSGGPLVRIDLLNPTINRYFFDPLVRVLPGVGLLTTGDDIGYQNFLHGINYIQGRWTGTYYRWASQPETAYALFNKEMTDDGGGAAPYNDYTGTTVSQFTDNFNINDFLQVVVDPPTGPGGTSAVIGLTGHIVQEVPGQADGSTGGQVAVSYIRVDGFVLENPGSGYLTIPNVTVQKRTYIQVPSGGIISNPLMIEVPPVPLALAHRKISNIYITDHGKGYEDVPSEIFVYAGVVTQTDIDNINSIIQNGTNWGNLRYDTFGAYYTYPPAYSSYGELRSFLTATIEQAQYSNDDVTQVLAGDASYVLSDLDNLRNSYGINALAASGMLTPATSDVWYEEPARKRIVNGKSNSYFIIGTTVGSTGQFTQWTASPSCFGYGYVESSAPVAIQDYYINRIHVDAPGAGNSLYFGSGAMGYTAGPPRVGLTGGGGYNCIYDSSVFPYGQSGAGNGLLGVKIDVSSGGYYEIEPLTEFGNGEDYSGLNIVIVANPSDSSYDGLAFTEPIMNGSIVSCAHSAGVPAYSSMKSQLPFNGITASATVYPMDGNGVDGAVEVDGWHYSFKLNAYVIDHIRITNPGSGYSEPPLIKVTFSGPSLKMPAYAGLYARIGGPLASVIVRNSATGFKFVPTIQINPYNQASNTRPYVAPTVADSLIDISSLAGSIANVTLTNQRLGFLTIPRVVVEDLPASGHLPSLSAMQELTYIHVDITDPGSGYINPPSVVITDVYGQGSGAVAKAIMNIPAKTGQSGPSGYEILVEGASGSRDPGSIFTVPGTSGYIYQPGQTGCVSGVAFVTHGNGYLGEVNVQFVRSPADGGARGRDAVAKAKSVHSSALGPPSISTMTTDGNGDGIKLNVSVNTGLFISGTTGTHQPRGIIEIPHMIDGIQSIAFSKEPNITYITFEDPARCWEIQEYAFAGCKNLSAVWLPSTLQRIGDGAFQNCPKLEAVIFKGFTGPALGNEVFKGSGGVSGTQFYIWKDHDYVTSYGGHSGWYDVNYLGGSGYVHNVTSAILSVEPLGFGAMAVLGETIVGTTGTTAKFRSIACDSQGYAYYSDDFGTLIQVDVYGNPYTLQDQYDVRDITIVSIKDATTGAVTDILYYLDNTGGCWYQQLPWPFDSDPDFPNPHPQQPLCQIPGNTVCTHITNDNNGYLYISAESLNCIYRVDPSTAEVIVWKSLNDTFQIGGMACDSHNNLSVSYPTQGLIYTYANVIDSPKILTGVELGAPTALVYDNANNLYITCGDPAWSAGIRILTSDGNKCSTFAGGFYTRGGIAINKVTSQLLFNDDYYLCQIPVSVSDISLNLLNGLSSHNYATVIKETSKTPNKIFILTAADVISINSTLDSESQVPLPSDVDVIEFICPDTDGSISAPAVDVNTTVTYATALRPGAVTIVDVGADQFTATYNDTSPPTITFINQFGGRIPQSSPKPAEPQTLEPGKSFTTYSGAKVILYSIGLTIFQVEVGSGFIAGLQGTPPPVCKSKQQGIDYSQYLSGDPSGALYKRYKEDTPDSSEWIRRQRLKHSVKFGSC